MNYTRLINKTEDYVEAHLGDKITLEDISDAIGISKYHFHRIFKEHATETLQCFITRIKMERSYMVLSVNPSLSVTEIAYSYGYSDSSAYIRAFKKHFHMTPSQVRNRKI